MRELALQHFVLAADNTYLLRSGEGPEGELFLNVVRQGHYGDSEERIAATWQGVYAFTPDGDLLASTSVYTAEAVEATLTDAVAAWNERSAADETIATAEASTQRDQRAHAGTRWQNFYPEDGLVLHSWARYLPHETESAPGQEPLDPERRSMDYAWFTADEMSGLVPARLEEGATREVDPAVVERLARFHVVDSVPCLPQCFDAEDVETAEMTARIERVDGARIHVRMEGRTRAASTSRMERAATWMRVEGPGPFVSEHGVTGRILGRAVYDTASERFVAFDMLAVGETWRAPWRAADAAPSPENRQVIPLGIGFSLAADTPSARIPPGFVELYGWDRPNTVRRTQRESVRRRTDTEPVD